MVRLVAWLRRTFVRGILLILPLAITYVLLRWLFRIVIGFSSPLVTGLLDQLAPSLRDSAVVGWLAPIVAFLITIATVLGVGLVGGNYLGRRVWSQFEQLLMKVPLVRWFYGSARQMMDALSASGGGAFREVVIVEYPRRGMWTVGFVTASAWGMLPGRPQEEGVLIFLPTTPNPTSGYTVLLPRSEAPPAPMTVDEGLKLIVSGGFLMPSSARPAAEPPRRSAP